MRERTRGALDQHRTWLISAAHDERSLAAVIVKPTFASSFLANLFVLPASGETTLGSMASNATGEQDEKASNGGHCASHLCLDHRDCARAREGGEMEGRKVEITGDAYVRKGHKRGQYTVYRPEGLCVQR